MSVANVPERVGDVDATIGCLREAGFSYPMADHAWNALDAYIYGFTLQKLNFPYLNGMSQEVIAGRHDGLHQLELGLDLLLDGLERMRKAS